MPNSLETLIDNLAQEGLKHFKQLMWAFPEENIAKLLLRETFSLNIKYHPFMLEFSFLFRCVTMKFPFPCF
jgi:hypothetical protein